MKTTEQVLPSARKDNLIIQELPGELLVYDLNLHKAYCLNQAAALVWKHCDGHTSVKQVVRLLRSESSFRIDEEAVRFALYQLGRAKLIEAGAASAGVRERLSRREMIARVGLTAAAGLPAVISIIAPKAVQAISCSCTPPLTECCRSGCPCRTGQFCCSGVCNGGSCA